MNNVNEVFMRADIQQIREFLLRGLEKSNLDPRPYKERIETAHRAFTTRLRREYPDEKDFEKITAPIYDYATTIEDVYMEIGLKVGAMLAAQAVQNLKAALGGK